MHTPGEPGRTGSRTHRRQHCKHITAAPAPYTSRARGADTTLAQPIQPGQTHIQCHRSTDCPLCCILIRSIIRLSPAVLWSTGPLRFRRSVLQLHLLGGALLLLPHLPEWLRLRGGVPRVLVFGLHLPLVRVGATLVEAAHIHQHFLEPHRGLVGLRQELLEGPVGLLLEQLEDFVLQRLLLHARPALLRALPPPPGEEALAAVGGDGQRPHGGQPRLAVAQRLHHPRLLVGLHDAPPRQVVVCLVIHADGLDVQLVLHLALHSHFAGGVVIP
mmetsp:Transcript_7139/g.14470  ORF Transcript_7139/g.14470 Transcript_7139/m.14470 type:complete len:273 (-) Transcript_7139:694-1512(-)